ncbi:hypothetical protein J4233_02770 [Candidatus Pacearchaeota archaeon]|nr:hypothetical protein [Candidatus Pacearchaeota archaeon]
MIANTLCEFLTQTDFRKPLDGRTREIAEKVEGLVYEGFINPPEPEKSERARIVLYAIGAYLALC